MRRVLKEKEHISTPSQLTINDMLNDLSARGITGTELGIRELYFNVFNPIINEGFFADKVVIVEGPSELYSIPIYSKCLGYDLDQNNVAVVHSDGKGPINRILKKNI